MLRRLPGHIGIPLHRASFAPVTFKTPPAAFGCRQAEPIQAAWPGPERLASGMRAARLHAASQHLFSGALSGHDAAQPQALPADSRSQRNLVRQGTLVPLARDAAAAASSAMRIDSLK